eukprot:Nitzschia sp. Nitz4//scaffold136_size62208//50062//52979//NITZ4_006377-RA/size62208-augustus-gene-0.2-mRNA-1//1//CDS//3329535645//4327//frame0
MFAARPLSLRVAARCLSTSIHRASMLQAQKALLGKRLIASTSVLSQSYQDVIDPVTVGSDNEDHSKYVVPKNATDKIISAEDAVALVRNGDTVCVSGFVCQGAPEALLKALGERFQETNEPKDLTLLFGGGPGDYGERGLSHLAKISEDGQTQMLRRTIGGHYGQVPKVAELVLGEKVEGWTLPMGSISRMIRATSNHSPGHITTVGKGTYVDPDIAGGAANESATKSTLHPKLISKLEIDGETNLMYKALPIQIALIRGTTADSTGNISCEHESLLCDQRIIAAAAKNTPGGLVIAQVKRVAADSSIPARNVDIPGALVDMVVVVDEKDHASLHAMSYLETHNSALTGEIRTPQKSVKKMQHDIRKIVARRAFLYLRPNVIVNLGIGIPDGVASIAAEEGMLEYMTLTTEPGSFGGLPASGHSFGPSFNNTSLVEMNAMFDFYNGGGLDYTFLGAAQIGANGDVNVSRMSKDRLTGPGGFIDISSCTPIVTYMCTFTAQGLKVKGDDGTLQILQEGKTRKFVPDVFEKTFSGDEAVKRGQTVYYVTERAVFQRTSKHDVIELIEIAPGVDLQKDILDQMEFEPVVSPDLKTMDPRIFMDAKMNVAADLFGNLEDRFSYHEQDHTMYLNLFGVSLSSEDDIAWFVESVSSILQPLVDAKGPIHMVVNYEGFDLSKGLEDSYQDKVEALRSSLYASIKRYTGDAFQRASLKNTLEMAEINIDDLFKKFDTSPDGLLSLQELQEGFLKYFHMTLTPSNIRHFMGESGTDMMVDKATFAHGIKKVLEDDK